MTSDVKLKPCEASSWVISESSGVINFLSTMALLAFSFIEIITYIFGLIYLKLYWRYFWQRASFSSILVLTQFHCVVSQIIQKNQYFCPSLFSPIQIYTVFQYVGSIELFFLYQYINIGLRFSISVHFTGNFCYWYKLGQWRHGNRIVIYAFMMQKWPVLE